MRSVFILALVFLNGCLMPSVKWERQERRVENAERQVETNRVERSNSGRDFTFAADVALGLDPFPSRHSQVAHDLTSRSLLATGLPPADEAVRLRGMVNDLVSTNEVQRVRGEEALKAKDEQLAALQRKADELGVKLQAAETKLLDLGRENSALADRWVSLRRAFYWVVAVCVFLGLCWLATIILPFFVPAVGPALGTMKRLVGAIQRHRDSSDSTGLDEILRQDLDEKDRWRIAQIKRKIGVV